MMFNHPADKAGAVTRVSVVIPTFNRERTLGRALDSVLQQTFNDYEIIICDDASNDATVDIARDYQKRDARIRLLCLANNQGPASARNRAMQAAKAQYIAFLDSDDEWLPEKLARQVQRMDQEPFETAICLCGDWLIKNENARSLVRHIPKVDWEIDTLRKFGCGEILFHTPTIFFRRECLKTVGFMTPEMRVNEDGEFLLRLFFNFNLAVIAEPLARIHLVVSPERKVYDALNAALPYNLRHANSIRLKAGRWVAARYTCITRMNVLQAAVRERKWRAACIHLRHRIRAFPWLTLRDVVVLVKAVLVSMRFSQSKPKRSHAGLTLGIDAANLRRGGGVTHLVEVLRAGEPGKHGIGQVVVWGGTSTLAQLPDRPWLVKIGPAALNKGLLRRSWWQMFSLSRQAQAVRCDLLFVPGGSYAGWFHPVVTMSQNLLPFQWRELRRYGLSLASLKLLLRRYIQTRTFRAADGLIFLSEYARQVVSAVIGQAPARPAMIPHGIDARFLLAPRVQRAISQYSDEQPFRILYVSIINVYKHQWHVVEAVAALRKAGLPIALDLVGPAANAKALRRLQAVIRQADPDGAWVSYHGAVAYAELHRQYAAAELGMFASSCENMPNILVETMAAGLPIACSNRGPMPEVLGQAGVYFDPEDPGDIARALRELVDCPELRQAKATASFALCQQYSWQRCADQTFAFLAQIARDKQPPQAVFFKRKLRR